MESRWFLFPGQTLENTTISERAHALHITQEGWNGITKHLDRKKFVQEAADKEAAIKRYLDEGSKDMTKGWGNSLDNVRKRKEEERLRLIEQKKDERQQRFLELRKEQEEIRTKYMDKVKKQIFMTTGHARALTSSLLLSEVLHEREKQQEFMDKIKEHEKEEDQKYLEMQREKAEKEIKLEEEKKRKAAEKRKEHTEELKKIIEEKASLEKYLREKRVNNEALDNIEAVKETEKLDRLILEEKMRTKKELFQERKKYLKHQEEVKQQKMKEEKELDEVVQIYQDAKHRIDCMKKQRVQDMRAEAVIRRDKIALLVMAEQQDKSEVEEQRMKTAIAEKDAVEQARIKAKQEHQAKMTQERLGNRQEVLAKEAEKRKKEEAYKKWELLNRYKTDENTMKYEENKRKEAWQDILKYREDLCEQMEEVRQEQLREREIEKTLEMSSLKEEDAKFFEYADEVVQLAKKRGRRTVPIERVIEKYVKEMHIPSEVYGNNNNPEDPKSSTDLKKKLVKPPKPKLCRCQCPKT